MRLGILTSGGDCPGLNAVIRGAVLQGTREHSDEFVGFKDGWRGVIERDYVELDWRAVRGLNRLGGTVLGTSRTNPFVSGLDDRTVYTALKESGIDALIAIGGEGTLSVAAKLQSGGVDVIGVPKTIDNDLSATDYSFGFDTAVEVATEAIDRIQTSGEAHRRCMVVEVMGRNAGWIALHAGIASSAHAILIPEVKSSISQICHWVESTRERGRTPLIVVAEGFALDVMDAPHHRHGLDTFGRPRLGGIGDILAPLIESETGIESRCTTLGYIQRGAVPTAFDRVLATRMGMAAVRAVHESRCGTMVAARGTELVSVPLKDAVSELKTVPVNRWFEAATLFG
ncbi:6-phosphofructokinase [Rhodococcus sp. ADH]|uniref:6-phosphofructokinase n=1 Tax=Nocardiaceae TaxID=85025 RepID=UPI00050CE640|nr:MULTISPECIES: ATP-dependent 6-phosphofructokinase [Rhodococcus]KPH20769.1 6-phosphofructokinase [Rhodococcus sp. ADH]RGP48032.1 6-phosphofructokinase [Rhodococcus erythropolis]